MSHRPRSGRAVGGASPVSGPGVSPGMSGSRVTTGPFGIKEERGTVGRDNPLHHRAPAGEAGRVPTPQLWDETPPPSWSQLRRRLRDDPEVRAVLLAELGRHPATAGRLTGLRPYRTPTPQPSHSTWFAGTWAPDGTDVLVKINITLRERFWMAAASAAATGLVPRVLASDTGLGGLDVAWLVLERLPLRLRPRVGRGRVGDRRGGAGGDVR